MTRSIKKGPYVNEKILKKVQGAKPADLGLIKVWDRACMVVPTEDMVGHRLGEFSETKKFWRHGGKMQKELDQKKKEAEIQAAKAAKSA